MTMLTEYLDAQGIEYEVLRHERTFTGIDEARSAVRRRRLVATPRG